MANLYKFLADYEVMIYILLAIGGLFSVRWLLQAWRERQTAFYQLEKEFSTRRFGQAAAITILLIAIFCLEFSMTTFIIPGLPAEVFLSTPTIDLTSSASGGLSSPASTQFPGQLGESSGSPQTGCVPGQVNLNAPKAGDEIKGIIDLVGTANISNFGFYKYEVATAGSETWATISAGRNIVNESSLGRWDTTAMTPGNYRLRLVVTDNQGNALPPCIIPVRIVPPP